VGEKNRQKEGKMSVGTRNGVELLKRTIGYRDKQRANKHCVVLVHSSLFDVGAGATW